jgi:phage terminase Nu1 subunit (DNA packaging protein)
MSKYISGKEASKQLGVHQRTLHAWDAKGIIKTIRTPGNKRLYDVKSFLRKKECNEDIKCIKNLDVLDEKKGRLSIRLTKTKENVIK